MPLKAGRRRNPTTKGNKRGAMSRWRGVDGNGNFLRDWKRCWGVRVVGKKKKKKKAYFVKSGSREIKNIREIGDGTIE